MSDTITKKRSDIVIIRVLSMIFILLNHSITYLIHGTLGKLLHEAFDIGIPLFLLISGFCFGMRKVSDWKKFYLRRFIKIIIPSYLFVIILVIWGGITSNVVYRLPTAIMYILNLQGLNVIAGLDVPLIEGAGPLWFITVIMICYLIIPILQRIKTEIQFRRIVYSILVVIFVAQVFTGVRLFYFFIFIVGYYYARFEKDKSFCLVWAMTLVVFILQIIRVRLNAIEQNMPFHLYETYACITFAILGIWLFRMIIILFRNNPSLNRIGEVNSVLYLDRISLYVYMVQLPLANFIFSHIANRPLGYLCWILTVFVFAILLKILVDTLMVWITEIPVIKQK